MRAKKAKALKRLAKLVIQQKGGNESAVKEESNKIKKVYKSNKGQI
jgi:hypothetical protein